VTLKAGAAAAVLRMAPALLLLLWSGCGGSAASASREPARSPSAPESVDASSSAPLEGPGERGEASYYAQSLAGRPTASGEPYTPTEMTAAHRTLPFGTLVEVAREDGRKVVVRINDRGPFRAGRIIDLSRRAAEDLGILRAGVAMVVVKVVKLAPPKAKRRSR